MMNKAPVRPAPESRLSTQELIQGFARQIAMPLTPDQANTVERLLRGEVVNLSGKPGRTKMLTVVNAIRERQQ